MKYCYLLKRIFKAWQNMRIYELLKTKGSLKAKEVIESLL